MSCGGSGTTINYPLNVNVTLEQPLAGDGSSIGNLNASNLAFGTVSSLLIPGGSLSNINASNISSGHISSLRIYGNTLSNINSSNINGLVGTSGNALSNLNASNLAFGIVSSSLIYGNTLSNINASNITQPFSNLSVSNSLIVGQNVTTTQGILHVNLGNAFIGNSYWVGSNSTNSVVNGPTRLVFDNTTTPYAANKILLHSNTASQNICGFGVTGVYNAVPITLSYYTSGDHSFSIGANQNFGGTEVFAIRSTGIIDMAGTKQAKLHVGIYGTPSTNTTTRIDGSNIALVTSGSGLVGFGTISPSANLHVIGNAYVSTSLGTPLANIVTLNVLAISNLNSLTTNLLATTANVGTLNVLAISNLNSLTTNLLATTANVGTLNVLAISNLNSLTVSNALTTTNVFASTVNATNPISFRNRVINGDFYIDQRNSGGATTPSVDGKPAIDRWKINIAGSGRCQVGQNLGSFASPTGFTSYFGMKVTTSNTVAANDYFFLSQDIEGVNTIDWMFGTSNAKTITLSFWVQSSLTGTAGGFVRNSGTSIGNYSRSYPFTFTINNTLTWEYKTIMIPGDTTGTWYNGQTDGIEFGIELWNGTTWQASPGAWAAGNYTGPSGGTINYAGTLNSVLNITGVQVEQGTVATPWERRLYDAQFAACQRYYEVTIARMGGYNTAGNYLRNSVYFNTKKRPASSPTFTVISTLESSNMGSLSFDNSNYDGSSARILVPVTATGDAYGQWKVSVDCEF
jgi:hypothetical protein